MTRLVCRQQWRQYHMPNRARRSFKTISKLPQSSVLVRSVSCGCDSLSLSMFLSWPCPQVLTVLCSIETSAWEVELSAACSTLGIIPAPMGCLSEYNLCSMYKGARSGAPKPDNRTQLVARVAIGLVTLRMSAPPPLLCLSSFVSSFVSHCE